MIFVSCLLAAIGVADIIRSRSPKIVVLIAAVTVGAAVLVALHLAIGTTLLILAISLGVFAAWIAGTSSRSSLVRKMAVGMLGAGVLAGIAFAPEPATTSGATSGVAAALPGAGVLQEWYAGLAYPALVDVSFGQALAVASLAVFLISSANIVVRTVLELRDDEDAPRTTRGRLGARRPVAAPLKGGRIIGPLERIFLFALALAGQFTAIGAIVAAKGIVRFPELSRDNSRGSNAELFLVGSFTSWALVLVAVLLARLGA